MEFQSELIQLAFSCSSLIDLSRKQGPCVLNVNSFGQQQKSVKCLNYATGRAGSGEVDSQQSIGQALCFQYENHRVLSRLTRLISSQSPLHWSFLNQ